MTQRHKIMRGLATLLLAITSANSAHADDKSRPANRLAKETSPYLLMHARNPVDWYPWGPEAFAKAKKEGKLVFLSIGYSSCYWCHVMERESFQNADVAKLMNEMFVCIKVDREERPEIDNIYMTALSVLGQRGGWPLSMFLTANGKPIVGGTYWPPDDRVVEGQKIRGFKSIMHFMREWNTEKAKEVEAQAEELAKLTAKSLSARPGADALVELDRSLVVAALDGLKADFDLVHGGFGSAEKNFKGTKFPMPPSLALLIGEARRTPSPELSNMVTLTLDRMARGGIHDQIGGGFHRYSTERTWTVPHFEKMLYDNAQLVETYATAFRLTRDPNYERVIRETLDFVSREMTSPNGAFYSALDAETEHEEGRYYVWTADELKKALPDAADLEFARTVFGIGDSPNFEAKYHVPVLPRSLVESARQLKMEDAAFQTKLAAVKRKLMDARSQRPRPFLDTKVLTSWNGQMIAGYAVAGEVLSEKRYVDAAAKAADFLLRTLRTNDGRLLRTYSAQPGKEPEAKLNGYLDDYAYLVHGLLCLHDATKEPRWLDEAKALSDTMVKHYADTEHGGFFYTSNDHEKLFARAKDQYDGVQPSGNSMATANFVGLWHVTGENRYRELAEETLRAFAGHLKTHPTGSPALAQALAMYIDKRADGGQLAQAKHETNQGGGAKKSDSVVKAKVDADKIGPDGKQVITLTLKIDDGWHLYANPVPEDFPGIPATVSVEGKTKPKDVKVEYPKGNLVKDALAGDHYIYEKEAKIKVIVTREKGDTGSLDVNIKVQSCSKQTCLVPGTIKLTVP